MINMFKFNVDKLYKKILIFFMLIVLWNMFLINYIMLSNNCLLVDCIFLEVIVSFEMIRYGKIDVL